jgi:hypothetical protein
MPKGKPWSLQEETKLRELISTGEPIETIAAKLGKSSGAVLKKAKRLGLEVVGCKRSKKTTTSILLPLPKELPSVEEALKILAGALKAAAEPGLDKVEVQRLQVVATLARTYKQLLTDYIGYREIEAKLVELEAKYAKLAQKAEKAKGHASKRNTAKMVQSPTK